MADKLIVVNMSR